MRKIDRLKKSAKESAEWRGHIMGKFETRGDNGAVSVCQVAGCNAQVVVNTRPMPNQIDIMGDAVAVDCPNRSNQ